MSTTSAIISREIQFLNESNRIEGIYDIKYETAFFQDVNKGHFGAYTISQSEAKNHDPLSIKMIRIWHTFLAREQHDYTRDAIQEEEIGHIRNVGLPKNVMIGRHIPPLFKDVPLFIMNFFEDINEDLQKNYELYKKDDKAFSKFIGSYFLRFERIHPFTDGNGRIGRLLVNYLATYCSRPILIFESEMLSRNRYIDAHESEEKMVAFMEKRIEESKKQSTY